MKTISFKSLFLLLFLMGCGSPEVKEPIRAMPPVESNLEAEQAVLKIIQRCENAYEKVQDYTAVLLKQERIQSSNLRAEETIFVKYKKPNQIYMKWIEEPNKGMEAIYPVRGTKMVVEPGGLLDIVTPKMYLNPTDNLSKLHNRHPITEADMGFLIQNYAADYRKALENDDLKVVLDRGVAYKDKVADKVEVFLPDDGYYCSRSVVYFDAEKALPLQAEFYGEDGKLFGRYVYTDFQANVGLKEIDFDEDNPEYDF